MPPNALPMKRNQAAADLNNDLEGPSKRRRPAEVVVLSSDSESDMPTTTDRKSLDLTSYEDNNDAFLAVDDVHDHHDSKHQHAQDSQDTQGSQPSQLRRSLGLLAQLHQDAFNEFKSDLCHEIDSLRKPEPIDTYDSDEEGTPPKDPAHGVREALFQWKKQGNARRYTNHLYYRLDRCYHEGQFPPPRYIGRDVWVVEALDRVARELELEMFLALLDRDNKDRAASYLARRVVDQQGRELLVDVPVEEQSWVQARLPSLRPVAPHYEVAVLLVPRDSLVDFVLQYTEVPAASTVAASARQNRDLAAFVEYVAARVSELDNRQRFLPVLKELGTKVWQLDEVKGLSVLGESAVFNLLKALVCAQDWGFLEQLTSHLGGSPAVAFFHWVALQVESGEVPMQKVERSLLSAALASTTSIDKLIIAHQFISSNAPRKGCESFVQQLIAHIPDDLSFHGSCSWAGQSFVELLCSIPGIEVLASKLPQIVKRNATHTSFVHGVLGSLLRLRQNEQHPAPVLKALFEQSAQHLVDGLDVSKLFQSAPHKWQDRSCLCWQTSSATSGCSGAVHGPHLAVTIAQLVVSGADSVLARFTTKVVANVALIPPEQLKALWLPFLGCLMERLKNHVDRLCTPRYRHLFAAILETYLARCVGPSPSEWKPRFKKVHCANCNICTPFNRFLKSSVSAASFGSVSGSDITHINYKLIPYSYKSYRCRFAMEGGALVVRKHYEVDTHAQLEWQSKMAMASAELRKLEVPAFREILGNDYPRIRAFEHFRKEKEKYPVPIESLGVEDVDGDTAPQTAGVRTSQHYRAAQSPVSTALGLSRTLQQPVGGSSRADQRFSAAPAGSLATSASSASASTPARPLAASQHGKHGPLPTPTTTPAAHSCDAGYKLFADELSARLRTLSSFTTPQSIQKAIQMRWRAMSEKNKQLYKARAKSASNSVTPAQPPPAVQFKPHRDRVPSTPRPSPHGTSQATKFWGAPNSTPVPEPGSRSRSGKPLASTPTRRGAAEAALPSSPSARGLASISLSRINSMVASRASPRVKREPSPRASSRASKRNVVEVIDLTGDSD